MSRIALICAFNRSNAGMFTVDYAAHALIASLPEAAQAALSHFTVEGSDATESGAASIDYRQLQSLDELEGFSAILFWGDFLHSRRYHLGDMYRRHLRAAPDASREEQEARKRVVTDLLLMRHAPEAMLRRTICFGGAININSPADERDTVYRDAIRRLYGSAALVMLRDPISAHFAHRYAGPAAGITLGVDCALLLEPTPALQWIRGKTGTKRRLGFSFGRGLTKSEDTAAAMQRFVEAFAQRFGFVEVVDIRWLRGIGKDAATDVGAKLSLLSSCDAIITDTYHCAINAWREGVPTFCVGLAADRPASTLSEKKKELLFAMFNAGDFYVFIEDILQPESLEKALERLRPCLDDPSRAKSVRANIGEAVGIARQRPSETLAKLLAA